MSRSLRHLSLRLKHRLGGLSLDVAFELTKPWSLIFAPSGAGKTTLLRGIAGLFRPRQARITTFATVSLRDGREVTAESVLTDTAAGVFRPPHLRGIRLVSQNPALFPHLSVLKNIQYNISGQRIGTNGDGQSEEVEPLLALCRVEHLAGKMPAQLSGGEKQRVALARCLAVPGTTLLLLDEPFTGLDISLREQIIVDLRAWLSRRNIPVLSVTHDVSEAFQLCGEVIKLEDGRVAAQGPVFEVLASERIRLLDQLRQRQQA